MKRSSTLFAAISCVILLTSGCYWAPRFEPPGTMAAQQSRAAIYDPFPSNDAAPPIVGGRPRDFDRPYAEPKLNQFNKAIPGGY